MSNKSKTLPHFFSTLHAWKNSHKVRECFVPIPDPETIDEDTWNAKWKSRVNFWKDSIIAFCNYFSIITTSIAELENVFKQGSENPPSLNLVIVCFFFFILVLFL